MVAVAASAERASEFLTFFPSRCSRLKRDGQEEREEREGFVCSLAAENNKFF